MFLTTDRFLFAIFLLLWAQASFAERADRNKPIHLEADQVIMDDDGFKHAIAYGNTAEFRQKREGLEGYVEGYGERIEYDSRTGTLNFREKARLKRDMDEVSGDNITYNVKTEIFRVNSGDTNPGNDRSQRVRAVLQPKTNESAAPQTTQGALPVKPDATRSPAQ
jgi:lipopolysaccharide export system protein LptA